MISNERITVRAVVNFPKFETTDEMSGKYQVVLGNLSPAAVEKLEEVGIKVRADNGDMGATIKPTSKWPIIPVDVDGNSFMGATSQIGYGSVVRATIKPFAYNVGGNSGVSPKIERIVIEELAVPQAGGEFVEGDVL